jgi:hypothetical protein
MILSWRASGPTGDPIAPRAALESKSGPDLAKKAAVQKTTIKRIFLSNNLRE